eukprot:14209888-Ditylum_brightwellii.AAC.1
MGLATMRGRRFEMQPLDLAVVIWIMLISPKSFLICHTPIPSHPLKRVRKFILASQKWKMFFGMLCTSSP